MSSCCLNDVRGRVGMPLCMCVHVRRCACVQKPPLPSTLPSSSPPPSGRQACSLCLYRRSVYSSAGLPPHLNGLDSQPRKKHSGTTGEDVLLNRGIGLGKSAGRPFLPSDLYQQTLKKDDTFIPQDWTSRKRGRRLPHTKSHSSLFSGWGFLLM